MVRIPKLGAAGALGVVALCGVVAFGCSKRPGALFPDVRPVVTFTGAPINSDQNNPAFYAFQMNWSGFDPDGRVDHFTYAIDPPDSLKAAAGAETTWVTTPKNGDIIFFRATLWDYSSNPPRARDFHIFVIKAWDNNGLASAPVWRAFFSYTIAPIVNITSPVPSGLLAAQIPPSVQISWTGADPDGQFTTKPIKYKFKMFSGATATFVDAHAVAGDTTLNHQYAPTFAGWDSTGPDSATAFFQNLTPGTNYTFVVVAFDEAGAYSPVFTLYSNVLQMTCTLASSNGPRIRIFNPLVDFTYQSGGYSTDPLQWVKIQIPAGTRITWNWSADPPQGAFIQYYRWMLDGDVNDQTPRSDENTDTRHWSQKSNAVTAATVGPFDTSVLDHFLYIEAADNTGGKSLGIVDMKPIQPTLNRDLLVVNDTRREPDKWSTNPPVGCPNPYGSGWPSIAELDTFLFAHGNVPWRCTVNPPGVLSQPGLFAGYSFDTLGTRQGFEVPTDGVPFSKLSQYKHVVWMLDLDGSQFVDNVSTIGPTTVLRYMSQASRVNTLGTYMQSHGQAWLLGGAAAYASLVTFDKSSNNTGNAVTGTVFTNSAGELVPGRMMYDLAHWQSSMICVKGVFAINRPSAIRGGWKHYDGFHQGPTGDPDTLTAPDYAQLPAAMNVRNSNVDAMTPTRTSASQYYPTSPPLEYLWDQNYVVEDVNPNPDIDDEQSVLDTLMVASGPVVDPLIATGGPCMTYYHGTQNTRFVFSGFSLWDFHRADCIQLVDFVLGQIWGLNRQPIDRGSAPAALRARPQPARALTPAQRTINARLPIGRSRE